MGTLFPGGGFFAQYALGGSAEVVVPDAPHEIRLSGSYLTTVAFAGSYQTNVALGGSYQSTVALAGSTETEN